MADAPLLVFGPWSTRYDFGPQHPLTPRRFGPGIDLLRALGAEPRLAPEPASDEDLLLCHTASYLRVVKRLSDHEVEPWAEAEAGIGPGDDPAFPDMHEAGAAVAGGSLRAVEAILRGDVGHAFHPGGGLHHAMPSRAAGFCIYDDPALAIARARAAGLRVLYVDLDVHHGDGVEAIHRDDPGVMTISFHESGRYLFPGTGFADELGEGAAAGTVVNVPFEPFAGERAWLPAVESLVPALAAAFGPDLVVSQHGCDTHAWDPLAHLRLTTTAMGAAARLVDRVAHRFAAGRWLATGGGGYDAYRVVPRAWSHVWLAGAHRDAPSETPDEWRSRWAAEAARYGQAPLPTHFDDPPNAGEPFDATQEAAEEESSARAAAIRTVVVPRLIDAAERHGWWSPNAMPDPAPGPGAADAEPRVGQPTIVRLDPAEVARLRVAPRVIAPADPVSALALLGGAIAAERPGAVTAAVVDDVIVGLAVLGPRLGDEPTPLLALGVAPAYRRRGLGSALLAAAIAGGQPPFEAIVGVAERDVVDPLPLTERAAIGRRLLERNGFRVERASGRRARVDSEALAAIRG